MRLACFLFALLTPTAAAADVVGVDPPADCPLGTRGSPTHCGPRCFARTCDDATTCEPGWSCASMELCVEDEPSCGGGGGTQRVVRATCAEGCGGGESCEPLRVCVDPSRDAGPLVPRDAGPEPGPGRGGCGCRAAPSATVPALAALALLGLLFIRSKLG